MRPRAGVRRATGGDTLWQHRPRHLLVRHRPPKGAGRAERTRPRPRPLPDSGRARAAGGVRPQVRNGRGLWGAERPGDDRETYGARRTAHAARSRQDAMLAAATHRSGGPLACPGLPSGPERSALAARGRRQAAAALWSLLCPEPPMPSPFDRSVTRRVQSTRTTPRTASRTCRAGAPSQ